MTSRHNCSRWVEKTSWGMYTRYIGLMMLSTWEEKERIRVAPARVLRLLEVSSRRGDGGDGRK